MATRIRLRRMGSKGRPFYRVVVADQRSPRDGRFIENIGRYHPLNDPSVIEIDQDRALHWLRVGAQPSDQVRNLMQKVGIWDTFVAERPNAAVVSTKPERPAKEKISKKAQAKAAEAQKAPAAPAQKAPVAPAPAAEVDAPAAEAAEAPPEPAAEAPADAEAPEATEDTAEA
jgi:small subunit ribosomal protein S16